MPKKQYPHEYTDANGNTVIHYKDGTSDFYTGGKDSAEHWLDVSNEADRMVGRTRYLPDKVHGLRPLQVRDEGVPGIDDLEDEDDAEGV